MARIVAYQTKYRIALLDLAIQAWEPVFPLLSVDVPAFVYESFYPSGWRDRQYQDLAGTLDSEPDSVELALDGDRPIGWVCTRLYPEDNLGEVYVLVVAPKHQRRGVSAGSSWRVRSQVYAPRA